MKLDYSTDSGKSFDAAVAAVEAEAAAHGFRVLYVHDVTATLAGKGFVREPYKIIEICQAGTAHEALQKDNLVGLMMPCKINVFTDAGQTRISALRPALIATFFPGVGLEDLAAQVDRDVIAIVDAAR
ncbi:MAG: DUF302 domain-containing protein [Candidatus Sericytochromatia bacterium]|nr:DUF302 domain-containing protein [Candidatus Sericytochromatia bacterium]